MSDLSTPILSLPFIAAAQAQKHVTHNEALQRLDVLVQLAVESFGAETPPASPGEGEVYALGASATGVWAGQAAGTIAAFSGGAWSFHLPRDGWIAGDAGTGEIRVWSGGAWGLLSTPESVPFLGINASADTTNRLSVNAPATLLNNAGAGHQLKLNKAASGDTASLLFQSGFTGHAEMGLAGTTDFSVKVSADGGTWFTALSAQGSDGSVSVSRLGVGTSSPTADLHVTGPARVGSYTVAGLPSASATGAGAMVFVSDEVGGAVMAFSDGSDWRRMTDRVIVS
ncbi:MAG: DUF2793 domain-containing protein [Pseudomonadota bacterium]